MHSRRTGLAKYSVRQCEFRPGSAPGSSGADGPEVVVMGDPATLFATERVALVGVRRGGLGRVGPLAEPPREFRRRNFRRQPGRVAGARPQCVGDGADGAPIDVVVVAVPPAVSLEEIPQAVLGRARERRLPVFSSGRTRGRRSIASRLSSRPAGPAAPPPSGRWPTDSRRAPTSTPCRGSKGRIFLSVDGRNPHGATHGSAVSHGGGPTPFSFPQWPQYNRGARRR